MLLCQPFWQKQVNEKLMNELNLIDTMWCPTVRNNKRREVVKTELEGWIITIK